MLRLIVSSHGKLAEELVESSYMIFGRQDGVFALEFNLDEDLNDIKEKYRTVLAGVPENDQVIFLCDLFGGSLMSTPPSIALRASSGVSKRSKAFVFPKRGSFATSIILSIGITFALTPGGAASVIRFLRSLSCATPSETTMILVGCVVFVQAVAT